MHFQPMHSSSFNTEGTYLKCTVFPRVDNVEKKMQNIFDKFLRPFFLWLGSWNGRTDCPVATEWGSVKLKVLGVFLGPLVTPEDNWRPRISAVEHVLLSWRQRSLSFRGKALIINALALSRIWCRVPGFYASFCFA